MKITVLDSGLCVRELGATPFSIVSVFVCPHENEVFSKVSVFKSLHVQGRFRKSPFLLETTPPTHRLRVNRRLNWTKMYAFPTKIHTCRRSLSRFGGKCGPQTFKNFTILTLLTVYAFDVRKRLLNFTII